MRNTIASLFVTAFLVACDQPSVPAVDQTSTAEPGSTTTEINESERLNQWFDARNEEALAMSPMTLTGLGRKELYDQIDDFSEAAEQEQLAWQAQTVEEMRASFDYNALSTVAKASYDLWVYQYESNLAVAPFRRHGYIFEQMSGSHAGMPNFLINMHRVDSEAEMQAYISRIAGIARSMDQLVVRAQVGAEEGVRPPRFAYQIVIRETMSIISGAPFDADSDVDSPLWSDAKKKIEGLLADDEIDEARARQLLSEVEQALLDSFGPSYQAVADWLQADIVNSDRQPRGASALNNGAAYYQAMLSRMTTTDLTADEIHSIGLNEVARIKQEMETLKEQVGFTGTLQEFFTFVKTDSRFLYPNDDEGRQGYIDDTTAFIDAMREKLPDYFGLLPQAELEVRRVEAFREQDGAPQHYQAGTPDGSRPGVYYAHLSDMNAMPEYDMESVAYHEGVPGHHLQISIARELTGVPEFQKRFRATAFSEGWGLYSELLAKEMGGFEDPYKDFGRLNAEIWRAIRLVVDTGLHAKGWSQQQAVDYFKQNSSIADAAIAAEVRRYLVIPGQATAYKIGMLKILELRQKARAELGERFDIRAFHDTVLGGGALPLSVLERVVDNWIEEIKAG